MLGNPKLHVRRLKAGQYLPSKGTYVLPGLFALSFIFESVQAQLASGHNRACLIRPLRGPTLSIPLICVNAVRAWIQ